MMKKIDYSEFRETKNLTDCKNGVYNIWLSNPDVDYGFKIFFKEYMGAKRFIEEEVVGEILSHDCHLFNIEYMFELLQDMYGIGLHPKPFEIVEHGSVYAIKIQKSLVDFSERTELAHQMLAELDDTELKKVIRDKYVVGMKRDKGNNYGEIDNKIVWIDLDVSSLEYSVKTKERLDAS